MTPARPLGGDPDGEVVAIVQARMGSTRLPGKVLADLAGRPVLARVVERARRATRVHEVVVATSRGPADDPVADLCAALSVRAVRGSEDDVLDRYHDAARVVGAAHVVRLTADCPLLDPEVIDAVVARYSEGGCDYASNVDPPTFPDGLDVEVFSRAALDTAWREARLRSEREHVTPYLRSQPARFRRANVTSATDLSGLRWTVDEPADLEFARAVYQHLGDAPFGMREVLDLLAARPALAAINRGFTRNAGLLRSLLADTVTT